MLAADCQIHKIVEAPLSLKKQSGKKHMYGDFSAQNQGNPSLELLHALSIFYNIIKIFCFTQTFTSKTPCIKFVFDFPLHCAMNSQT